MISQYFSYLEDETKIRCSKFVAVLLLYLLCQWYENHQQHQQQQTKKNENQKLSFEEKTSSANLIDVYDYDGIQSYIGPGK
ncbi:hypothetical protein DERF_003141 [Dermatophagoides farinae]|uniref:Uncharacterized protein n=1 Tax=Dermatophagoides farinae TaxID=6954 RepID=A0A922ID26_DERFA|nr:hypothetical protein DERF_003141 [Dermatophagoides farinae]